ncbi:reverse transcriptase domain-containing protein [Bradyrhizobium japonicum]|uniref:reverse transcriptase domain-containing protein n=1 Tax=Bradyrhizobium japonicum TaxID=375 RepID=UPI0035CBEE11
MNAGECVRRLFFVIFAPDSQQESSPLSGRKSTQATVRICGASSRVYWFFRTILKCEADVADTLTRLSTYRKRLPTGSPLSPFLAYFAYSDTWEKVASVARTHGLTLTVYVDDVTLSGRRVPRKIVWEIQKVIHASGLRYHKEKTYFDRAAEITGVIVDRDR